jgi:hypothetical protein
MQYEFHILWIWLSSKTLLRSPESPVGVQRSSRAGSFVESYPLFGFRPEDYDELFVEQLDLVLAIRELVEVYRFEQVRRYQALPRAEYDP